MVKINNYLNNACMHLNMAYIIKIIIDLLKQVYVNKMNNCLNNAYVC